MFRIRSMAVAGAALTLLAACEGPLEIERQPPTANGLFDRYVSLGNSLTAGYQSGGINDSTQKESYAYLFGRLAMGDTYAYPQLAGRGCAPPVANFQTQERVGGPTVTDKTCDLRTESSVTAVLNNVAVPGATSLDPFSTSTDASNALTTFILGGRTQVQAALAADPTFVSVWTGNNDVLEAAVSGVLTPMGGVSRGVTPVATYTTNLDQVTAPLAAAPNLEGGVLIGVVNVTSTPVLFPAAALFNPQFKAGFDQYAGTTTTILPSCTPTSQALISFRIVSEIRKYVASGGTSGHPPVIACARGQFPPSALVGELFVLDPAEIATLVQTVTGYNAALQAKATALGWAYFDPNPLLATLRQSGAIPIVPNLASATNTFGDYISLDGVHPRRPAHVLIANGMVAAINAKYGTNLGTVQ
jgi:lysophospholipase L1-like esterase